MTTDNRTNEPSEAQVEAAAKTMHETRNPWFEAYGDWGAAGFEIKKAFRDSARAALVAAQGAARPVNGFDTTAEHAKNGADSLHVAPQPLDPEKVADIGEQAYDEWENSDEIDSIGPYFACALCEAAKRGELS